MMNEELKAVSPIDGRYKKHVAELENYFSEFAVIRNRIRIEIEYLIALSERKAVRAFTKTEKEFLRRVYRGFDLTDAKRVKEIERETKHDVKAVEYFIKSKLHNSSLNDVLEMVHFGLTSDDVNNLAHAIVLRDAVKEVYLPALIGLVKKIVEMAEQYKKIPMLARTHGQPASPTTVGKEFINFACRLKDRLENFKDLKFPGKLNCATGNYSALFTAYPKTDWIGFSKEFISKLGLEPKIMTTQIIPHDKISDIFRNIISINNIVLNLDIDMWMYISDEYFGQRTSKAEVGSSVMPHKVNPIDFENSEGNLKVANAMFNMLADKLQVSRLQRDLSDSTVKRNYGVAFAHSIIAYKNTLAGLNIIYPNTERIAEELNNHPEVITEAVQTVLRREGCKAPYKKLKELTRGKRVTLENIHSFIKGLEIPENVKKQLLAIRPENYIGLAVRLTEIGIEECKNEIKPIKPFL